MAKEARQGQILYALCLLETATEPSAIADDMRALINEFDELFLTPHNLPPPRAIEHHITLKEGTDPINVRPYRYAHFQKDKIERQVNDMLQYGIIRPSSAHYPPQFYL